MTVQHEQSASESELRSAYEAVGRAMVDLTTTVRGADEWPAIAELWRRCMEERDEALTKLQMLEAQAKRNSTDAGMLDWLDLNSHRVRFAKGYKSKPDAWFYDAPDDEGWLVAGSLRAAIAAARGDTLVDRSSPQRTASSDAEAKR